MQRAGPFLACALGLLLASLTWIHCGVFHDKETLYEASLVRNPYCWMAEINDPLHQIFGEPDITSPWRRCAPKKVTYLEHAPQLAVATLDVPQGMHEENQFLASRLGGWAPAGFQRPNQPVFLEYLEWRYAGKPVERAILSAESEEANRPW